jgi:hypothetical protein
MMKMGENPMPSLQIRDLPRHLYEILSEKARRNRRSLAQQATIELERMAEAESRTRRLDAVAALRAAVHADGTRETSVDPVAAIREDRDR